MRWQNQVRLIAIVFLVSLFPSGNAPTCFAQKTRTPLLTLKGHTTLVSRVAFSPDGKRLATSATYGVYARVWDLTTGREVLTFKEHKDKLNTYDVRDVAFSPDGKWIASASWDHTAKLWDSQTGKVSRTLEHPDAVYCLAISPDGKKVATGSRDKRVRLWDVATGKKLFTLEKHAIGVLSVAFSPDGKRLASGDSDTWVKLWDVANGKELFTLKQERYRGAWNLAFSPDGKRLVTAGDDVEMWDAKTGQHLYSWEGDAKTLELYHSVAFSPDGKRLVAANGEWGDQFKEGKRGTIKFWNPKTGKTIDSFTAHQSDCYSVAFSPDGKRLATGSGNGTVKIWDVGEKLR